MRALLCFFWVTAVGCNLAVPAFVGAVQGLPSHLSKACVPAGGDTLSKGLAQHAIPGNGEAQTGNICTYLCRIAISMVAVCHKGMTKVILQFECNLQH